MFVFANIGAIVDHHFLDIIVRFVGIGVIVDHHYLEAIVGFANIGVIVHPRCWSFEFMIVSTKDKLA